MALARFSAYTIAATIFVGTTYVVGLAYAPPPKYKVSDEKRAETFNTLAPEYESKTRKQEFYLGIGRMRRRLLREEANGRVLEVGAGTGNNIELYPSDQVTEVIFADRTPAMVEACRAKIQSRLGYKPHNYFDGELTPPPKITAPVAAGNSDGKLTKPEPVRISPEQPAEIQEKIGQLIEKRPKRSKKLDAEGHSDPTERIFDPKGVVYSIAKFPAEVIPFPDDTFDTVVDMFGLCSYDDPVQAVREMARVCKPGGKLLLLEHGRGTWGFMNDYLDKWAPRHAMKWGCWWNRDIRRYIRMSGCQVIIREEKHLGTTQMMIMTPMKDGHEAEQIALNKKRKEEVEARIKERGY